MDKKADLEQALVIVKSSFEAEGKFFTRWELIPYDPRQPKGQYIVIAEADWLTSMGNRNLAGKTISGRIWELARPCIKDIAYVLTDYNPQWEYGAVND